MGGGMRATFPLEPQKTQLRNLRKRAQQHRKHDAGQSKRPLRPSRRLTPVKLTPHQVAMLSEGLVRAELSRLG